MCISAASKLLESSIFAPIQYIQLIAGFIFGYLFFKDLPDIYEVLGSLIIALSGLFIFYRESNLGLRPFLNTKTRLRDFFLRLH
jgi:drug/metabolite transporter (DMT)-like permease